MTNTRALAGFLALLIISLTQLSCGTGKPSADQKMEDSLHNGQNFLKLHADSVEADFKQRIRKIPGGDLNHDGQADTLTVFPPHYINPGNPLDGCAGDSCYCTVHFSCKLPDIQKVTGTGLYFSNIGDIDHDGFDELAFVPEWPTSVWQSLTVYSYQSGNWRLAGQGTVNIGEIDNDPDFIKKHITVPDKTHFVILSDSLGAETDSLFKTPRIFTLK